VNNRPWRQTSSNQRQFLSPGVKGLELQSKASKTF
jgi:hypothetical protein